MIYETRRATGADLGILYDFWTSAGLPARDLQSRFAEFYIVTKGETVCAAAGLRLMGQQALVHHEAYVHPRAAEMIRPVLWERMLNAAQNSGAARIWVKRSGREYRRLGFTVPDTESLCFFPKEFGAVSGPWRVRKLKDETPEVVEELCQVELEANKERQNNQRLVANVGRVGGVIAVTVFFAFALFMFLLGRR